MNPEDLITDTLRERTDHTDYPTTPMATVTARAYAVRARRRRTTLLVAAASVAAMAVPGAVWLNNSADSSPGPSHKPSSGTTQTTASDVLRSIPRGTKPGIDYLVGDTYMTSSGDRIRSRVFRRATTATPTRGGILASVPREPGFAAQDRIGNTYLVGTQGSRYLGCGSDRFAVSTDMTESAYWLADHCPVPSTGKLFSGAYSTMSESGPGYVATAPGGDVLEPVGILAQGTVVNQWNGASGNPALVPPDGRGRVIPMLANAAGSDENHDVVSGQMVTKPDIGVVVDISTRAILWETDPGWTLGQFSTDGRYVVGRGSEGELGIFDAVGGQRLASLQPFGKGVFVVEWAWDVDDTLLAVVSDGQQEAIVRFDLTGHVTLATPIRLLVHRTDVYRLATRP